MNDKWEPPDTVTVDTTEISETEGEFGIHCPDTVRRRAVNGNGSFPALAPDQRQSLRSELLKREPDQAEQVFYLFDRWKSEIYHQVQAETYEQLVKDAVAVPVPVRHGGANASDPSQGQIDTYRDLYRVTQCFLEVNYGPRIHLYRGVREASIARLTGQLLDNPETDRVYVRTSVVANHSGLKAVASHHATGVVIHWTPPRRLVTMAVDHVYDSPMPEDEFQIVGGTITLDPDGVIHEGHHTGDSRKLTTTIRALETPAELSKEYHKDVAVLVKYMFQNHVGVNTREGAERLQGWLDEFGRTDIYSAERRSLVKGYAKYVLEKNQTDDGRYPG